MREVWDAEAERYDEPADHGLRDPDVREAWRSLLVQVVGDAPCDVADLGCGTGSLVVLLAGEGHRVTGIDLSPAMLAQARAKAHGVEPRPVLLEADASAPPLAPRSFDVVLSRHVLWATPDPAVALDRWLALLRPGGRLVLVEGRWSTGAGLTAADCEALVQARRAHVELTHLAGPALWGRPIDDERYLLVSDR
ncbi:class I SAM-dependent methyltransferase [Agrococcus terreus]|uniref:SAM-dependent methyltransferase n=1 Tax=Agrococcus terreus TaxID=574649 RepID=A0ABQ2KMJ2_9MICO|nr:class I SAM-dependent methyltransferase [Agrococcus terreus]GGN84332.1 SAM-dependent methyltransferase [Agrococcus terreus]